MALLHPKSAGWWHAGAASAAGASGCASGTTVPASIGRAALDPLDDEAALDPDEPDELEPDDDDAPELDPDEPFDEDEDAEEPALPATAVLDALEPPCALALLPDEALAVSELPDAGSPTPEPASGAPPHADRHTPSPIPHSLCTL
jgi:hypothetical protein